MATVTVTLTGNAHDMLDGDFDVRRTKVYLRHNTDYISDPEAGVLRLGSGTVPIGADGAFSLDSVIAAVDTVDNLQATVLIDYPDPYSKTRVVKPFGPYDLSALGDGETVDITELETTQALDVSRASALMTQMEGLVDDAEAARDAAVDISNIDVDDDIVEALVKNTGGAGPKTSAALTASIDDRATDEDGVIVEFNDGRFVLGTTPDVGGGRIPKAVRAPGIAVLDAWPTATQRYTPLWASGATCYSVAADYSIRKSTDAGRSWTRKNTSALTYQLGFRGCFLKLASGVLLAIENGSTTTPTIRRSTDDGVTWSSAVLTFNTGTQVLGPQSWVQDQVTGYVYVTEYVPAASQGTVTAVKIRRSTDDGATWSDFHTFDGPASASTATKITHLHGAAWDAVSNRVYFTTGDTTLSSGIYRVNAAGTDIETVVTSSQIGNQNGVGGLGEPTARCIGLMFFPTHIAWVTDETIGNFCRMPRTDIGVASPAVEVVYTGLASGWGTAQASSDGSAWVASVDSDGETAFDNIADKAAHLYYVTNNGATVAEIAHNPAGTSSTYYTGLVPVGQAHQQDDEYLWLQTSFGATGTSTKGYPWQARCTLVKGGAQTLRPTVRPLNHGEPVTLNFPETSLAAGATVNLWTQAYDANHPYLYVIDWGIYRHSGTGVPVLEVVRASDSTNFVFQGPTATFRSGVRFDDEYAVNGAQFTSGNLVIKVVETGGSASATFSAFVKFAWGPPQTQRLW